MKNGIFSGDLGKSALLVLDQKLSKFEEAESLGADSKITSAIKSSITDLKLLCQEAQSLTLGERSQEDVSSLHSRYTNTVSNLTNVVTIVSSKFAGISPISKVVPGAQGANTTNDVDTASKMVQAAHLKVNTARDNLQEAQKRADAAFERDLHNSKQVSSQEKRKVLLKAPHSLFSISLLKPSKI